MRFKSRTVQAGGKQGQVAIKQKPSFVGYGNFFFFFFASLSPGSQFETSRLILTGHIYQCEQLSIGIWSFSFLGIPTAEICPWELPSPTMCSKSPTPAGQFWVVQAGNWWSQVLPVCPKCVRCW